MSPSPIVTGSISSRTWRTRSSRNANESCRWKPSRRSIGSAIANWTIGADEDADRVAVELVLAA